MNDTLDNLAASLERLVANVATIYDDTTPIISRDNCTGFSLKRMKPFFEEPLAKRRRVMVPLEAKHIVAVKSKGNQKQSALKKLQAQIAIKLKDDRAKEQHKDESTNDRN